MMPVIFRVTAAVIAQFRGSGICRKSFKDPVAEHHYDLHELFREIDELSCEVEIRRSEHGGPILREQRKISML